MWNEYRNDDEVVRFDMPQIPDELLRYYLAENDYVSSRSTASYFV